MIKIFTMSLALMLMSATHGFTQELNAQLDPCADPKSPQCQKIGMGLTASSKSPRNNSDLGRSRLHKGLGLQMAKPVVLGNCPKRPIYTVLKRSQKDLLSCAQKINELDDRSIGRLTLQWTVNPKGEVSKLTTKNTTLQNQSLARCLLNKVQQLRFPKIGSNQCLVRQKMTIRPNYYR